MMWFNILLSIVALGFALWMAQRVFTLRNESTVGCHYINGYRIFILFCLCLSVLTFFLGFEDIWDVIRSISITLMVGLFLCNREGAGENGFVYNLQLIPYEEISRYDYQRTSKNVELYVVYRQKSADHTEEGEILLKFKLADEQNIHNLLETKIPKKHKRIKKLTK